MIILVFDNIPKAGDVFSEKAVFLEDPVYNKTNGCIEFALAVTESDNSQPFKVYENLPVLKNDNNGFEISISRRSKELLFDLINYTKTRILISRYDSQDQEIYNKVVYPHSIEYHFNYILGKGKLRRMTVLSVDETGNDLEFELYFNDYKDTCKDKIKILKD